MASEKDLLRALDLLTVAPPRLETLTLSRRDGEHVDNLRRVVDSENVVAVGISEKESDGQLTGRLALTFYVARKIPLAKLRADQAVPPALPEGRGGHARGLRPQGQAPDDAQQQPRPRRERPRPEGRRHPLPGRKRAVPLVAQVMKMPTPE